MRFLGSIARCLVICTLVTACGVPVSPLLNSEVIPPALGVTLQPGDEVPGGGTPATPPEMETYSGFSN